MFSIADAIETAIRESAVISIVYNGGSHPGMSRKLIPTTITADTVHAIDGASHITKTFKIDKIASVTFPDGRSIKNLQSIPVQQPIIPVFTSFPEYVAHFRLVIPLTNWHVIETENYFGLAGFFKNGKPKQSASVSIQYLDRSVETIFDLDTGELKTQARDLTGREKPWRVDSPNFSQGRTLSQLHKAAELFLSEAMQISL